MAALLGDRGGLTQAATGIAALGVLLGSASTQGALAKRAVKKTQRSALETLQSAPEYRTADADRLLDILRTRVSPLRPDYLISASQQAKRHGQDMPIALAVCIHRGITFDGDDATTKNLCIADAAGRNARLL